MTIGLGILLIVLGMIFAFDVIHANLSAIDGHALGWILILGGILAIVLPMVIAQQRNRRVGDTVVEERPVRRRTVVEERRIDPEPPL